MQGSEKLCHLARVVRLIYADGKVTPGENQVLKVLFRELGVALEKLPEVKDLAKSDRPIPKLRRFSDQLRNFEDCLLVALCDQDLDAREKELLLDFARELELRQTHLDRVHAQTLDRLRSIFDFIRCPVCLTEMPSHRERCLECHYPLKDAPPAPAAPVDPQAERKRKGDEFEQFVVKLFQKRHGHPQCWRSDKCHDGIFALDSLRPDLEYADGRGRRFQVECKWRSRAFQDAVTWARTDQVERYRSFDTPEAPVFIVLGLGGQPSAPARLFAAPCAALPGDTVRLDALRAFERSPREPFAFDGRALR